MLNQREITQTKIANSFQSARVDCRAGAYPWLYRFCAGWSEHDILSDCWGCFLLYILTTYGF